MKKFVFSLLCFSIFFSNSVFAASVFEIKEPFAIYKNIIEGKKLVHTFEFKNSGDEKLEIKNMRAKG